MTDIPLRHLNLAGASNFRDVGGYAAGDGRSVRWRRIFRSNHLGHLTADDVKLVRGLGVKRAFDFRGAEERKAAVCVIDEIVVHSLPIEPTVVAALRARLQARALSSADALDIMRDSYRGYVRTNTHSFREMFAHMVQDSAPLVIHCTAGKDRTGFASALLLTLLGVPWDDVMADYLRTNELWIGHIGRYPELDIDTRAAIIEARTPYLEAAFAVVRDDFGSPEAFAEKALGLDAKARERMKADLLE
jgi:protein-tyrosine phosphatase